MSAQSDNRKTNTNKRAALIAQRSDEKRQRSQSTQGQRIYFAKREDLLAIHFQFPTSTETVNAFEQANRIHLQPSREFKELHKSNLRVYRVLGTEAIDAAELLPRLHYREEVAQISDVYVHIDQRGQGLVLIDDMISEFKPILCQIMLPFPAKISFS